MGLDLASVNAIVIDNDLCRASVDVGQGVGIGAPLVVDDVADLAAMAAVEDDQHAAVAAVGAVVNEALAAARGLDASTHAVAPCKVLAWRTLHVRRQTRR